MNIKSLKIGNLVARLPIIQGGMGIGVSRSKLAAAVTNAGGIGVISAAQVGYDEEDFEYNNLEANIRALKKHITIAKQKTMGGVIGVNIMVAMNNYAEHVKAAIESGADIIISGAGMPISLPKLVKGYDIKIAPIVSSLKSARVIMKLWDRHDKIAPDMIVIEGPRAGGHLGFKKDDLEKCSENFSNEVISIIEETKIYADKYNKHIPVIVAGGVYNGEDIAAYLNLGADGVQMATRFVATEECDASEEFKKAYINSKKKDIVIVSSPVGMPGRALLNTFVEKTFKGNIKANKCYKCISHCNPSETPYCISKALINGVTGDLDNALIFCGDNAYKIKEIVTVSQLMKELESEILKI
ncbi:MAG: nitronate monooxygenase [Clostridium sp.]|uniref:NAD(P)H-dependent flavin oxidoreductase n=1 Tax=Clostridium sp. TaxID=1506 RepID=UPI0030564F05